MKSKTEERNQMRDNAYNKTRKCRLCGKLIGDHRFVSPASGPVHESCWTKTF